MNAVHRDQENHCPVTLVIAPRRLGRLSREHPRRFAGARDLGADGVGARRPAGRRRRPRRPPRGPARRAAPAHPHPGRHRPGRAVAGRGPRRLRGMAVNVEIKNLPTEDYDPPLAVVPRWSRSCAGGGDPERWLISCFDLATVDACHELAPELPTAFLVPRPQGRRGHRGRRRPRPPCHPPVGALRGRGLRRARPRRRPPW